MIKYDIDGEQVVLTPEDAALFVTKYPPFGLGQATWATKPTHKYNPATGGLDALHIDQSLKERLDSFFPGEGERRYIELTPPGMPVEIIEWLTDLASEDDLVEICGRVRLAVANAMTVFAEEKLKAIR